MKIMDKIVEKKAKKLGLSAEEYMEKIKAELEAEEKLEELEEKLDELEEQKEREQEKLDEQIWIQLYLERKVINPFMHLQDDKRLWLLKCLSLVPLIYWGIGEISNIFEMKIIIKTYKYYLYFGILICVLCGLMYLIGRILIYKHDKKQFEKYKAEMELKHKELEVGE